MTLTNSSNLNFILYLNAITQLRLFKQSLHLFTSLHHKSLSFSMSPISSLPSTTPPLIPHFTKPKNPFFTTKHKHSQSLKPKVAFFTSSHSSKPHCTSLDTISPADSDPEPPELIDGTADVLDAVWEGAVVYRRNAGVEQHLEYSTTLERLGLGKLSSGVSKLKAGLMGLRVGKVKEELKDGTPVLVSVDVGRRRRNKDGVRLDGVVRSVITLACNRCGEPAAEPVFSNFTILLTEEPIEEPETIDLGVILGEDKSKSSTVIGGEEDEDDETSIDMDDLLYFPSEVKEIDISKNIRDLLHLEITLNAICDPRCKGLCLRCGANLNTGNCSCNRQEGKQKRYGPLGNLKKQMQTK